MILVLTNTTAAAITGLPLPDGGLVPALGSRTFNDIDSARLEQALEVLDPYFDSGDLTYSLRPDGDERDLGNRIYRETLRVQHGDLDAAALTQVIESSYTFPEGARLRGYHLTLAEEFAGSAVATCTADVGYGAAAKADLLDDGADVFTGAGLGETFGQGANATPTQPHPLGGEKLRVLITTAVANVDQLAAGDLTATVYYSIH